MNLTQDQIDAVEYALRPGVSKAEAARMFFISPRTLGRWMEKYNKGEEVAKETSSSNQSLTEDDDDIYHVSAESRFITITKVSDGEAHSESISRGDDRFYEISDIVWEGRGSKESLMKAYSMISDKELIETFFDFDDIIVDSETGMVSVLDIEYDQEIVMKGSLVDRLVNAARNETNNLQSLLSFTRNLSKNPSGRVVDEVYEFIEAMDIGITELGYLVCYKKVREDYKDCHTGTIDNSPTNPNPVKVPRNTVDEDSYRLCSRGLHVCSKSYLPYYPGKRIVKCLVHPKDVVSVPKEYFSVDDSGEYRAKMRVCEYHVIDDVTDEME